MKKESVLLIINPVAGRKKAKTMLYRIVDPLCRTNHKITIFTTAQRGEAASLIAEDGRAFDKIVCCGGDGTLNEILTGLARAELCLPVGYIPTGTTNDLAAALELPCRLSAAMKNILAGQIRRHDIGRLCGDRYFAYTASFGAFTKVAYSTPQRLKNLLGRAAYVFGGLASIGDIQPRRVTVQTDTERIEGDFVYGGLSNSTVLGGTVRFNKKDVVFDDGLFELLLIRRPKNAGELQKILDGIITRRYDSRQVIFAKTSRAVFSFDRPTEWTVDGEYAGRYQRAEIENAPLKAHIIGK